MVNVSNTYTRYQNKVLRYDYDVLNRQVLIRIRITINENGNEYITPVTPLYEARLENVANIRSVPARPQELEPRNLETCFKDPNVEREYTRTVYVPYAPTNPDHNRHVIELINYPGLLALQYKGEVYNSRYEVLL